MGLNGLHLVLGKGHKTVRAWPWCQAGAKTIGVLPLQEGELRGECMFCQLLGGPPLGLSRPGQESDRAPQKEMDVITIGCGAKKGRWKQKGGETEGERGQEGGREREKRRKEKEEERREQEGKGTEGKEGREGRGRESQILYYALGNSATKSLFLMHNC